MGGCCALQCRVCDDLFEISKYPGMWLYTSGPSKHVSNCSVSSVRATENAAIRCLTSRWRSLKYFVHICRCEMISGERVTLSTSSPCERLLHAAGRKSLERKTLRLGGCRGPPLARSSSSVQQGSATRATFVFVVSRRAFSWRRSISKIDVSHIPQG